MIAPRTAPEQHLDFVRRAIATLSQDERIVGIAAAGSWADDNMDEFSDIDFVIAVEPARFADITPDRQRIAQSLGPLLTWFTGDHVGEPRLLVCLYGPPALHVDLKFVSLADAGRRVDEPSILWQRGDCLTRAFQSGQAAYPLPDAQWIEDRFWAWVHYGATKIARGELFEALEVLSFLRITVLGPLALLRAGKRPTGVRRIETALPEFAAALRGTVATYDPRACFDAIDQCIVLYRSVRGTAITARVTAESEALRYLGEQRVRHAGRGTPI